MCGIAGILPFATRPDRAVPLAGGGIVSSREAAARMVSYLRHRGPDACGLEALNRAGPEEPARSPMVALGHTRLAILDLSSAGRQPMASGDGELWITYNGEVYNFLELRQELGDTLTGWRSGTDTEVILRAYAKWGRHCLDRLRGMFAFALWDDRRRELFLARDRLGIKPLYYYVGDGFLVFASEVGALLASGLVPPRLDATGLWQYLAYQSVPAPRTLIRGVRALPPGSWLAADGAGTLTQGRYWDLLERAAPEARVATAAGSRRRVGELLREAVSLHLISDVPLGVFLSGGIDSSAIVALMCEANHRPRTFSVAFTEREYDETPYARQVADRYRTDHTELLLKEQDLLQQLPEALAAMDQPTGDGVNTYVVARAVRRAGMTVALSGLGGDELFAGYPSFARLDRSARLFRFWSRTPAQVRTAAARAVQALGGSSFRVRKLAAMLESDGSLATLLPLTRQVLSLDQRRALLEPSWSEAAAGLPDPYVQLLQQAFDGRPDGRSGADFLSRISYSEARTYMHDVLLRDTDQMSMAHGLEVRVPLLDHKLVEYVIGLPDHQKRPDGLPKRLLVESLPGLLPEGIAQRRKQGFTLPFEPWMRGPLRAFCEQRLGPDRLAGRGILRPDRVQALWQRFLAGGRDVSWSRLWVLVALEDWLDRLGVVAPAGGAGS
jgi:asparagine synthase (glutamine-hydrolysing)